MFPSAVADLLAEDHFMATQVEYRNVLAIYG
uniref:Myosin motor domain-containing protein n=1 Tax=Steinernema glaseri TaxID=37863 RepID=A0A1I7YBC9_9BILA